MKKISLFAMVIAFVASLSFAVNANAQGNPLKNIPFNGSAMGMSNATFSIDDFLVKNNAIYVSTTLRADNGVIIPDVEALVVIDNATCNSLDMRIISTELPVVPVEISANNFTISSLPVYVSMKKTNDNRIKNALCSIADLYGKNASLNAVVANLKAAIRAY